MKVVITPEAERSLFGIVTYLREQWGETAVRKFKTNIRKTITRIRKHPRSFPVSHSSGLRRALVSRQVSMIYHYENGVTTILLFWDARQDPEKIIKKDER